MEVHKAKINDQLATGNPSLACLLARQQQRGGFAHHQASLNVLEQWKLAQLLHQLLALPEGDLVTSEEILTVPIVDAPHSGPLPPEPVTEAAFQSQLLGTCPACKFQSCKWQRHRNGSMWYRCCRFPECE